MSLRLTARLTGLVSALLLSLTAAPAQAADQVVLKYRVFERSIAVSDLTQFAETGELNRPLRRYIRLSGQQPERVRETLTQEFAVSPLVLDRLLNSPIGETALGQLSQAIYPSSREADETALRSALVLSATDDGQISFIEVLRNYPTPQVYIDGERLAEAYSQLRALSDRIGPLLQDIGL